MATIKVFDVNGVKELQCFDTLDVIPYLEDEEVEDDQQEDNPFA